jgi:hypothetical protein
MMGQFLQHAEGDVSFIGPLYADAYRSEGSEAPFFLEGLAPYLEFVVSVGARKMPVQVYHVVEGNREYFLIQVRDQRACCVPNANKLPCVVAKTRCVLGF